MTRARRRGEEGGDHPRRPGGILGPASSAPKTRPKPFSSRTGRTTDTHNTRDCCCSSLLGRPLGTKQNRELRQEERGGGRARFGFSSSAATSGTTSSNGSDPTRPLKAASTTSTTAHPNRSASRGEKKSRVLSFFLSPLESPTEKCPRASERVWQSTGDRFWSLTGARIFPAAALSSQEKDSLRSRRKRIKRGERGLQNFPARVRNWRRRLGKIRGFLGGREFLA